MKIAHLIIAHKNSFQLARLINTLNHPNFDFYIHLDKKSDINNFKNLNDFNNVYFIKRRVSIRWAGYGTIQATLNGFKEILPKEYEFINVISGQDFALKTANYINDYLQSRKGTEFITCESIKETWTEAQPRVEKYHLINWNFPGKYLIENFINKILPKRNFPLNYTIVGRANWFTLTPKAATYILSFLNQHPEVIRYFKYCWGADEFIFATILYNSDFQEKIVPNLVYVDWTGQKEGHPRILDTTDYDKLINSEKLFARKFDMNINSEIIDRLESYVKRLQ